MSITPTPGSATATRSGRCSITAPTSRPPFEPPSMPSRAGDVNFSRTRNSSAAMKSSKTFCFFSGMLEKKQNVFDDFIAALEFLVREKFTSPARLGIEGGSNGGLLVGAVMEQRPDLVAVALPGVGVMDMLRFDKFTGGRYWTTEYGSATNSAQFPFLIKYSPLHNLKKGTCYPATLVTTADHDDRVVPSHSFKFAAALQAAQGCDKP